MDHKQRPGRHQEPVWNACHIGFSRVRTTDSLPVPRDSVHHACSTANISAPADREYTFGSCLGEGKAAFPCPLWAWVRVDLCYHMKNTRAGTASLLSPPIADSWGPRAEQASRLPSSPLHSTNNDHNDIPHLHNTLLRRYSRSPCRNSSRGSLKYLCQVGLKQEQKYSCDGTGNQGAERGATL